MNSKQALARIGKVLGRRAAIRDSKKPTSQEQRDADRARRLEVRLRRDDAEARMKVRRQQLLSADQEYQAIKAEYTALAAEFDTIPYLRYRYSAGTDEGWCFSVKQQADTLEELVEKIEGARAAA